MQTFRWRCYHGAEALGRVFSGLGLHPDWVRERCKDAGVLFVPSRQVEDGRFGYRVEVFVKDEKNDAGDAWPDVFYSDVNGKLLFLGLCVGLWGNYPDRDS